ncbi:MAG: spermidine/putrescine ABC transporter substrate-binding protein [Acidimicrobiia bacterium]
MSTNEPLKVLMPRAVADRVAATLNRRRFLAATGATAMAAWLAACGGDDDDSSGGSTAGGTEASGSGSGDFDKKINLFTWAEYDDQDLLASWGNIQPTIFNSNEEAIQKLAAAGGTSGFDMVVPTGVYIPQMSAEGLLMELDLSRIPNFANLDTPYTNQAWDPGNKYSVCKNWGTTGWIYDTTQVTTEINTWADFIAAAQGEASGKTSVLDTAPNLCGIYFWANGIDWTTEEAADLDACEAFLVDEFAQHVKAFDSYPGIALAQGNYALSHVWNGDARQGLISIEEAGGDPAQYKWGVGAPETELWMDNWCIVDGAANVDAAYDFMNFILDPANSITDLQFHGYNTGLKDIDALLPPDLKFKDMVFFTPEEVGRMKGGAVNTAQDRLVEIYNNVKAKAGG